MMSQRPYILNYRWKPGAIFQASTLKVEFPEVRKISYHTLAGMKIGHATGTGRIDKRHLDIRSPEVDGYVFRVPLSAPGVKSVVRRIRPSEAAVLDDLDAQIEALQAQLAALKEQRRSALKRAWDKANVVRLREVLELLPDAPWR
jgi:Lhr-like helicase